MFLGFSLSGQATSPLADPSRDASMLMSFVHLERAKALSKAIGAGIDRYGMTGEHPVSSEEVRDLTIKALGPRNLARFASITEEGGVKSLNNGNKLAGNFNTAELMLYSLGLTPKTLELSHDANELLWKNQEKMKAKVASYGKLWSELELSKDWDGLADLQRKATIEGMDLSSVIASAKRRNSLKTEQPSSRQYDPSVVYELEKLGLLR